MLKKVQSVAIQGLTGVPVEVEVDLSRGFPGFVIVGLPDTGVQEARERMKSAARNRGLTFPATYHITVNLAPADIRKEGPAYDLPMIVGILAAEYGLEFDHTKSIFVGEVGLDGSIRHTKGILPIAIYAHEQGIPEIFISAENAEEAGLVQDLTIYPVTYLEEIIAHLQGIKRIEPYVRKPMTEETPLLGDAFDMHYIKGQEFAKRAMEIAASGGHNVLMSGPPGSGKTLLARTLPSILPPLTPTEQLEVTKIYSVAGLLAPGNPLMRTRPFRAPHHSASGVALVGGGKFPRPGEISLAHRGVLFLDEVPEFHRSVLEYLRQPLEEGLITISRSHGSLTFPARSMLIASKNPCPCGYRNDRERSCTCSALQSASYEKKLSGPFLDRIDLHVEVPRVPFEKLTEKNSGDTSECIRHKVKAARERQTHRFEGTLLTNSEMRNKEIKEYCKVDEQTVTLLRQAIERLNLSARSYYRILKIARTIADLAESDRLQKEHVAEALQYREKTTYE